MAYRRGGGKITLTEVDLSGPFFQGDPSKRFRENARGMLLAIAEEGEREIKARAPYYTGSKGDPNAHIRDFIRGRVKSLSGKPWALTSVVSSLFHFYNTDYGKHYGYGQKLERQSHFFRKGVTAVRKTRRENLLKGLQ